MERQNTFKWQGELLMYTPFNEKTYEYYGLSTDEKPIEGVGNGSIFFAADTCQVFMFDEEHQVWIELK